MTLSDLVAPHDLARVQEAVARRISGEIDSSQPHYGFSGVRKDGEEIVAEVHGSRSEFEGRPMVVGTLLDVTESRRVEEERG